MRDIENLLILFLKAVQIQQFILSNMAPFGMDSKEKKKAFKKFCRGKTHTEVLQKKREVAVNQKSKMLREYAKLCKREGIQSDRVNLGESREPHDTAKATSSRISKTKSRTPFDKVLSSHSDTTSHAQIDTNHEQKKSENPKSKKHSDRNYKTKKGQPILNNHIKSILSKLSPLSSSWEVLNLHETKPQMKSSYINCVAHGI